jgi:hypothetical protein
VNTTGRLKGLLVTVQRPASGRSGRATGFRPPIPPTPEPLPSAQSAPGHGPHLTALRRLPRRVARSGRPGGHLHRHPAYRRRHARGVLGQHGQPAVLPATGRPGGARPRVVPPTWATGDLPPPPPAISRRDRAGRPRGGSRQRRRTRVLAKRVKIMTRPVSPVLVTGATGYTGRVVVQALVRRGGAGAGHGARGGLRAVADLISGQVGSAVGEGLGAWCWRSWPAGQGSITRGA